MSVLVVIVRLKKLVWFVVMLCFVWVKDGVGVVEFVLIVLIFFIIYLMFFEIIVVISIMCKIMYVFLDIVDFVM